MIYPNLTEILRTVSPEMVSGLKGEPQLEDMCEDIKRDIVEHLPNITKKWDIDAIDCEGLAGVYVGLWNSRYNAIADISEKRDLLYFDLLSELRLQKMLPERYINRKGWK